MTYEKAVELLQMEIVPMYDGRVEINTIDYDIWPTRCSVQEMAEAFSAFMREVLSLKEEDFPQRRGCL